ncbi:hypothetical protein NL43_00785 [Methanosphaera sp. WGK6]|nr:hypothetical protein NL43_00785 [Methanosphaera sp. WGK6]
MKSEEYNLNNLISETSLCSTYHDLINPKDKINSKYQKNYNQSYHNIDIELYKLNRMIKHKEQIINSEINKKTLKISDKLKNKL